MIDYSQLSDFDVVFFYGQNDLEIETKSDLISGLIQPKRTLYYNRNDGAGVVEKENFPNTIILNVFLRYSIVNWIGLRNTQVSDGTNGMPDRRVAVSQNFIEFINNKNNLDINVFYIPFADYKNIKSVSIPGVI